MQAPAERSSSASNLPTAQPAGLDLSRPAARSPSTSPADSACVRELPAGARIVTGNAGDHQLVLELLVQTRQAPLAEDFQSRLDEPSYRPSDRLLVRRDRTLLAHVHLASHIAWFEGQRVPVVKLEDFASLPEYRHVGYDDELVDLAETMAAAEGAVAAVVHADRDRADFFEEHGFSRLRGQGHTRSDARAVLAHLDAQEAARRRRRRPAVTIRTWRHFELDPVRQLYEQTAAELWGPLYRSEACWQWLIGRKAQDQILLAVERRKPEPSEPAEEGALAGNDRVVGYAVVRGSCVVEMMTLPDHAAVRIQLLARACRDAIDRDHHWISLYTPAADPLHELLVTAGGAWISDVTAGEPCWLMKLLAPEKWVERLYPVWHARARAAGISRPIELDFVSGHERWRFTLTRRSARLERTAATPSQRIECRRSALESLLAGNLLMPQAIADGMLKLPAPNLAAPLTALFPARLFWQSPLELMRL
jgi:predicted acetyltransferase